MNEAVLGNEGGKENKPEIGALNGREYIFAGLSFAFYHEYYIQNHINFPNSPVG